MALVLTPDECARVNAALTKALENAESNTLMDLLAALKASDVRGKLRVRPAAVCTQLSGTVCCEPVCAWLCLIAHGPIMTAFHAP